MQASNIPLWVVILSALLTPTIAFVGAGIALLQWITAEKKRKIDLFDKRYELYQRLEKQLFDIITWAPGDKSFNRKEFVATVDELQFVFKPWIISFRKNLLSSYFSYLMDIDQGQAKFHEKNSNREDLSTIYTNLAGSFFKDMHIS